MNAGGSGNGRYWFFLNPSNWPLFFHTALNMRTIQGLGVVDRTLRHAVVPRLPIDFDNRYEARIPDRLRCEPAPIVANTSVIRGTYSDGHRREFRDRADELANRRFTYLNRTIEFDAADGIDWHDDRIYRHPQLWRIKFHSFDFLGDIVYGYDSPDGCPAGITTAIDELLVDWCASIEIGDSNYLRREWIPHTVSLRIMNLARYLSWSASNDRTAEELTREVYKNLLFLGNHVEHGVGGNHLVENAGALILGGVFVGEHGDEFVDEGVTILVDAADQFLADGGHFERSPMYHIYCLTRYLSAIHVLEAAEFTVPSALVRTAERATGFLDTLRPPDGRIPLLNDSVFGESIPLESCRSYAASIGIESTDMGAQMEASGYYWLGSGADRMLVDGGEVGPRHLTAHSHNDLLSFLLWVNGHRIVTDTGTFEYAPTPERQYSRSVAAHSTVQVDEAEPIDIGGRYVMGKRVSPTVSYDGTGQVTVFQGSYRKSGFLGSGYTHHRTIYHDRDWWLIWDRLAGTDSRGAVSRIHLHPSTAVDRNGGSARIDTVDDTSVWLYPLRSGRLSESTTHYYPNFGERHPRSTIQLKPRESVCGFGFLVSKSRVRDVAVVETDWRSPDRSGEPAALIIGGDRIDLPAVRLSGPRGDRRDDTGRRGH